jgi:hypothetical protein
MPRTVKKSKGSGYDIVEPSGRVVGHSTTKAKAQRSANAANAATRKKEEDRRRPSSRGR